LEGFQGFQRFLESGCGRHVAFAERRVAASCGALGKGAEVRRGEVLRAGWILRENEVEDNWIAGSVVGIGNKVRYSEQFWATDRWSTKVNE
jgi:hypothetical protein